MLENNLDAGRLQLIYDRTAAFYDEVVAEHQAAAKEIALELLDRRAGERFLELAFGTGWAFARVIETSGVEGAYGLDLAPGMVEVTRRRLSAESGMLPALLLGDCSRLPFAEGVFDCLLCTYTLECLPAGLITATVQEMQRVLHRGGRAVIAGLTEGEGDDAAFTEEWKRGYTRDPEFFGGARPLRLVRLLAAAGFEVNERAYSGHGAGWPSEVVRATKRW